MSYDIWIESEPCPHCGHAPESSRGWNYTSNMSAAWRTAGADLAEFNDKPAAECAAVLAKAIEAMEADPERFRSFDSPNGWGSMETLVPALRSLLSMMQAAPSGVVKVWH